jgi:hypothetical protein
MTLEEIDKAGRRLAKIINDPPPILESAKDLADYADYVEVIWGLRNMAERAELSSVRYGLDPAGTRKRLRGKWAAFEQRRDLHKQGATARKKAGDKTRRDVLALYAKLATHPSPVAVIAERLGLTGGYVRRILRPVRSVRQKKTVQSVSDRAKSAVTPAARSFSAGDQDGSSPSTRRPDRRDR